MIEIKDLLSKWSHLLGKEEVKKASLLRILNEVLNINIPSQDINIRNNTIYLNIKPIYKSEILMKREEIFRKLEEALGDKAPDEIR